MVDVDVDVFLLSQNLPLSGGKISQNPMMFFCGNLVCCFKGREKNVVGYQTAHPLAPRVQVCDFCQRNDMYVCQFRSQMRLPLSMENWGKGDGFSQICILQSLFLSFNLNPNVSEFSCFRPMDSS